MKLITRAEINILKEAKRIFKNSGYIDIIKLAQDLGINVFGNDLKNQNSYIRRNQITGKYEIYVNYKHSKERQRFSIAHEIGHYFLHKDKIDNNLIIERNGATSLNIAEERKADKIAVAILTPGKIVKEYLQSINVSENTEITSDILNNFLKKFNISKPFAIIRLKELGYYINQGLWQ